MTSGSYASRMMPLGLMVLCATVSGDVGAATSEQEAPDAAGTLLSLEDVLAKLEPVLPFLELDHLACLDETTTLTHRADDRFPEIRVRNREAAISFSIDDSPAGLRSFRTDLARVPWGLGREAAIAVEAVLPRVNAFLERVAVDLPMGLDHFELDDSIHTVGSPMEGLQWRVRRSYTHEGVPILGCHVLLSVSAYTGRIKFFSNRPPTALPASMDVRMAAAEAKRCAKEWYTQHVCSITAPVTFSEPARWIMNPDYRRRLQESRFEGNLELLDAPRLVWHVRFESSRNPPLGTVTTFGSLFLDCLTGDLIGGLAQGVKHDRPPEPEEDE